MIHTRHMHNHASLSCRSYHARASTCIYDISDDKSMYINTCHWLVYILLPVPKLRGNHPIACSGKHNPSKVEPLTVGTCIYLALRNRGGYVCMYMYMYIVKFSYLPSPDKSLWDSPISSSRAGGNEVSYPTALQQSVHVFAIEVETNKVPHLQQTDANHSGLCTGTITESVYSTVLCVSECMVPRSGKGRHTLGIHWCYTRSNNA